MSPQRPTPEDLTPEDIQAFIDGELDGARAQAVAGMIAADPALAQDVAAYRDDKALLAAHYAPMLDKPVPDAWLQRIADFQARPMAPPHRRFVRPLLALAASLVLMIAGTLAYRAFTAVNIETAVNQAVAARDNSNGTVIPADAAKVSAALGMTLKLPDLSKAGYTLAQVAVLRDRGANAVRIDYRNAANQVFTLYLHASSGREAFDLIKRGDLRICLWQDDVLSTIMMGEMSAAEMLRVASLAYNGLYF